MTPNENHLKFNEINQQITRNEGRELQTQLQILHSQTNWMDFFLFYYELQISPQILQSKCN